VLAHARHFLNDASCDAVKVEWFDRCLEVSALLVKEGIPVMGHIGLTPQTVDKIGGFKVQGKDAETALRLIQQAEALEACGCFSIVLECVPDKIAVLITQRLRIPTIGIGAGSGCDGQVLVLHDLLGLYERFKPKFVKQYCNVSGVIAGALEEYKKEVLRGEFPTPAHAFSITDEEFRKLKERL
jgi:3-methyl-2-oxobutanoate hydroxymethyltransferase